MTDFLNQNPCWEIKANAYLTPPESRGFSAHWDLTDVYLMQLEGEKAWNVWEPLFTNPFFSADQVGLESTLKQFCENGPPAKSTVLQKGSTLFLPRGHIHSGRTKSLASFHVTFGFKLPTVLDQLKNKVQNFENKENVLQVLMDHFNQNFYSNHPEFLKASERLSSKLKEHQYETN